MIASSDPLNVILACVWTLVCAGAICLTWYAYFRWKNNPDNSLSHNIAIYLVRSPVVAATIGLVVGVVLGIFLGHFCWPVELEAAP